MLGDASEKSHEATVLEEIQIKHRRLAASEQRMFAFIATALVISLILVIAIRW